MPRSPFRVIDPEAVERAEREILRGQAQREARRILASACDPTRLNILRIIRKTPLAASDLAQVIGRTRSATSQHLRVLREVEAVVAERRGNVIRYRLGESPSAQVLADICSAFDRLTAQKLRA